MNILITGGAGFIGSHVADAFLAEGHSVTLVDNLATGDERNVPQDATFVKKSILDEDFASLVVSGGFDVVAHHAAQMDVRKSVEDPIYDATVNVLGSIRLLEACVKGKVKKVIYSSTGGAVYGEPSFLPVTENHPVMPECQYGISKHTAEHYIQLYDFLYGLNYTIFRYPNVYGPRQNPRGEAGVNAIFIGCLLQGKTPVIFGDGGQTRDYVYVGDVARANVLALSSGDGEILNLGSGIGTSVNQIYETLAKLLDVSDGPTYAEERKGEIQRIYLDAAKAKKILGWESQVSFEEGLSQTIDYFKSHPDRL